MQKFSLYSKSLIVLLALAGFKCAAQFRDLSLSGFPPGLIADFQNLTGYKEVEFRELYVHAGDTLIPKQLVCKYTYDKTSVKERYDKHIYAEGYTLHSFYMEETAFIFKPDSYCVSNIATYYHPKDGIRTSGSKRYRYRNSHSSGVEEFFYKNEQLYAQKQKKNTLTDSTYKMSDREWQNGVLVSQKDTVFIRLSPPPVKETIEREPKPKHDDSPYLQYDHPIHRPYRYVVTERHSYTTDEHIYKFIYHGSDTLAYRVEYYQANRKYDYPDEGADVEYNKVNKKYSDRDEGPKAIILMENYIGRIPTLITYFEKQHDEKRIVWIALKK